MHYGRMIAAVRSNENIQKLDSFLRASVDRTRSILPNTAHGLDFCPRIKKTTAPACWVQWCVHVLLEQNVEPAGSCPIQNKEVELLRVLLLLLPEYTSLTTSAMLALGAATSSMSFLCCGILTRLFSLRLRHAHAARPPRCARRCLWGHASGERNRERRTWYVGILT